MKEERKENLDLLYGNGNKNESIIHQHRDDDPIDSPPDGGLRAYAVVVASFLTNGLMFGVINSYSIIHEELRSQLIAINVPHADSKASLVGALSLGTTFLLSPISGILTAFLGLRQTAVLGGLIATVGMLLSSFLTRNVTALYFTYGVLYGLGASLAYTPSLAILSHYFKKYLSRVNGIVTIGSSLFSVLIPFLMEHMIKNYSLIWLFRVLAVLTFGVVLCGLTFKPIPIVIIDDRLKNKAGLKKLFKVILDVHIWRNVQYRIWALSLPVALFGYFIPYVHLKVFIKQNFENINPNVPLQCIAAMSGIGRLMFGFLGDRPNIDRILLQQISFYVIGTLTILLPFVKNVPLLIIVALGMGLFDGAFIALIGPIAVELCGNHYAGEAIGTMLGMAALPLSLGPLVGGYMFEYYQTYTGAFVMAGISPLVGATLMFAVRIFGRRQLAKNKSLESAQVVPLQMKNGNATHDPSAL